MLCLQLAVVAFASATVFLRVRMPTDTLVDGRKFLAFLFFSIYFMNASAWSELSITVSPFFSARCANVQYVQAPGSHHYLPVTACVNKNTFDDGSNQ